jgi:hypothetical protein
MGKSGPCRKTEPGAPDQASATAKAEAEGGGAVVHERGARGRGEPPSERGRKGKGNVLDRDGRPRSVDPSIERLISSRR